MSNSITLKQAFNNHLEKNRKILWIAGSYYPDIGGAEISLRTMIKYLFKLGWGNVVLTQRLARDPCDYVRRGR